jgi:8-oxo-dGTP pyrophosphatase MutT (NUDIX family)
MPISPTHAGGIVRRQTDAGYQYLLVTARSANEDWVWPKGHIETGETAALAAIREVSEEAGVIARIVRSLRTLRLGPEVLVEYFLMDALEQQPSPEGRKVRWCSLGGARVLLRYPEALSLLQDVERLEEEGGGESQ